ncbi:MAG: shikimate dehydrogenase [Myxococcota bacterium]
MPPPSEKARFAAILGERPSRTSKSPALWNAAFRALGIDVEYLALDVDAAELAARVRALRSEPRFLGGNVTVPHKIAIVPLLDAVDDTARRVGAVNTIARGDGALAAGLVGGNTDGAGALRALRDALGNLAGRSALLLGAGGAARAIAFALSGAIAPGRLWIANRTAVRAADLAAAAGGEAVAWCDLDAIAPRCDLVVNATRVGHGSAESPLSLEVVRRFTRASFFDAVYEPAETALLAHARAAGRPALGGKPMLLAQAAEAFVRVCGSLLPRGVDAARVHALMEAAW